MCPISINEVSMETQVQTTSVLLTPAAADVVRGLLQQRSLDETYALRVYIAGRSCSGFQYGMALDNQPRETDASFDCEGLKILVDEESIQYMSGATIDYIDDERGKGFLVENPNAAPACSCEGGSCGEASEN
jgi:iron-sulfur cluster insertion protein